MFMRVTLMTLGVFATTGNQHMRVAVDDLGHVTPLPDAPLVSAAGQHEASKEAQEDADSYKMLTPAVVRFQGLVRGVDPLNPWESTGRGQVFGGSGFIVDVDDEGPLMVTAAHAVADTSLIRVQAPGIDEKALYKAGVVLINVDFDVALLRLHPDSWLAMQKTLEENDKELKTLTMYKGAAKIGMDTVVLGFPAKSKEVKVTSGALSGHENVGDFVVYQQTAPIGPGISGGPLMLAGTNEVLGINFATNAAANAQNINFAIPGWRVTQMMDVYHKQSEEIGAEVKKIQAKKQREQEEEEAKEEEMTSKDEETDDTEQRAATDGEDDDEPSTHAKHSHSKKKVATHHKKKVAAHSNTTGKDVTGQTQVTFELAICMMRPEMCEMKIPKMRVVSSPSDDDVRDYYGCESGLFLSKVTKHSLLAHAQPPIDSKSFLMTVNDIKLDNYGMGVNDQYIDDPVSYSDLLFMGKDLSKRSHVKTCSCGKVREHEVDLKWRDSLRPGVYSVDQPSLTKSDFEMAAGIVVHPLTVNIAKFLVQAGRLDVLQYVTNQDGPPALVVSGYTGSGMGMGDDPTVSIGSIIKTVNGKEVSTLKDFRDAFIPTKDDMKCTQSDNLYWTLTTADGEQLVAEYKNMLKEALVMGDKLTPAMLKAVKAFVKADREAKRAAAKKDKTHSSHSSQDADDDEDDDGLGDDEAMVHAQSAVEQKATLEVILDGKKVQVEGDSFGDLPFDDSVPIEERTDVRRGGLEYDVIQAAYVTK